MFCLSLTMPLTWCMVWAQYAGTRDSESAGALMYQVWADGREFGIDYATLDDARRAKAVFVAHWPHVRYYIRKG